MVQPGALASAGLRGERGRVVSRKVEGIGLSLIQFLVWRCPYLKLFCSFFGGRRCRKEKAKLEEMHPACKNLLGKGYFIFTSFWLSVLHQADGRVSLFWFTCCVLKSYLCETENYLVDAFRGEMARCYLTALADAGFLPNSLNTFCINTWRKDTEVVGGWSFP